MDPSPFGSESKAKRSLSIVADNRLAAVGISSVNELRVRNPSDLCSTMSPTGCDVVHSTGDRRSER